MTEGDGEAVVGEAFLVACRSELRALKPGNVHDFAGGHRMTVADFETSAAVAAPAIARQGATVGERVLSAMQATVDAVGQNTNLGILLLCAPLACAFERLGGRRVGRRDFRHVLAAVLDETSLADAESVYRAIRLASPGGLGTVAEHDARESPRITLKAAMAAAADRDRIARQYVTAYGDIFTVGLPALDAATLTQGEPIWRTTAVYFAFASGVADTHVLRKHGAEVAEWTRSQFAEHRDFLGPESAGRLLSFDAALKSRHINPGTSADLTVATIMASQLMNDK